MAKSVGLSIIQKRARFKCLLFVPITLTTGKEHKKNMVWKGIKKGCFICEKIWRKQKTKPKHKFIYCALWKWFSGTQLSYKIPKIYAGTLWVAWSWTNRSVGGLSVWFNLLPVVDRCQWNTSIFAGRTERRLIELKAQLLILNGQACPENKGRTAKVAIFWGRHNGGLL